MGVITGSHKDSFISAEQIYSKVRRHLKSFVGANLIDDGEFPLYTMEVLKELGISTMKETEDVLEIVNNRAPIPKGLEEIHAIYKCTPIINNSSNYKSQNKSSIVQEVTCETYKEKNSCNIKCQYDNNTISKITTEMFVNDLYSSCSYVNPILLRLSPNVKQFCSDTCVNMVSTSDLEITMKDGYFLTNFNNDSIYIKYYALPLDCDGLPMIPDIIQVQKAIEYYIIYQVLLGLWYNSEVSDIGNKWQKAEQDYLMAMQECRYINKLPRFSTLMNEARNKRAHGMVNYFNQQLNK